MPENMLPEYFEFVKEKRDAGLTSYEPIWNWLMYDRLRGLYRASADYYYIEFGPADVPKYVLTNIESFCRQKGLQPLPSILE